MTLKALLERLRILPSEPREALLRQLLRNVPTIVVISSLTLAMDHLGWFRGFETYALDSLLRSKSSQVSPNLVIVTIDDEDYHGMFSGTSPIDPKQLQKLLDAIEKGQPRVIGVDLDTSAEAFSGLRSPRAVWARDARPVCAQAPDPLDPDEACETEDLVRLSACGGKLEERGVQERHETHLETDPLSGVVVFPQDYDGVVRRYRRTFRSTLAEPASKLVGEVDSLPWAIVKQYAEVTPKPSTECDRVGKLLAAADSHELLLNFAGDHYRFNRVPARAVMQGQDEPYWKDNSPLKDTIVLLGGTYREARDAYVTPVGTRYGVELIAQAIESDLQGGGIRELNWIVALFLEFLTSAILIFLDWRFPGAKSIYLNLLAIVVMSLVASFLAFNAVAYWFNFTAVLLAIWIHLLWEHAQEHRNLRRELEECHRRERAAGSTSGA